MNYLVLIFGFILLIKGADLFIDGASSVAKRYGLSPMAIGLTVVALGTSTPEVAVGINSALKGANDLTLGNVIGSNIFNLLIVVGITAVIRPVNIKKVTIRKEFPFLLLNSAVLFILTGDVFLGVSDRDIIDRGDGLILLTFFIVFIYYLTGLTLKDGENMQNNIELLSPRKNIVYILAGGIGIWLGGEWVVDSSVAIATSLGISRAMIGFTVIAVGTSLPELVTSIVASRKGANEIVIGNVVGSNVCNILLVLGISTAIKPIDVDATAFYDIILLSTITVIAFYFATVDERIKKKEGVSLIIMYILYMIYVINR